MVTARLVLLAAVGLERLVELFVSARHAKLAFASGGLEFGQGHWLPMRLLHTGLLLGCLLEPLTWPQWVSFEQFAACLCLVVAAQLLRYWAVWSLGTAWNVRVIVVPGSEAKRGGPYRFLRHPNYVAVVVEGLALPLACGAYLTAGAFLLLNAWLLRVRIRTEERALQSLTEGYHLVGT